MAEPLGGWETRLAHRVLCDGMVSPRGRGNSLKSGKRGGGGGLDGLTGWTLLMCFNPNSRHLQWKGRGWGVGGWGGVCKHLILFDAFELIGWE